MNQRSISFGDTVRVKNSSTTVESGHAGLVGTVYGHTKPSVSGVEVIGLSEEDFAINVHFDELNASVWFDESLLDFVDCGVGQEISLKGVDKKWVRGKNGEWYEQSTRRVPWWKFW